MKPSEFDFKALRTQFSDLTQEQLAAMLKVSPATLRRWEEESQYAKYKALQQQSPDLTQEQFAGTLKVSLNKLHRWEKADRGIKEEQPLKRHHEVLLRQLLAIAENDTIDKATAREVYLDPYRFLLTASAEPAGQTGVGPEGEAPTPGASHTSFVTDGGGQTLKSGIDNAQAGSTGGAAAAGALAAGTAAGITATLGTAGIAATSGAVLATLVGGSIVPFVGGAIGAALYNILKKKEGK